jgi:hypothetical protein
MSFKSKLLFDGVDDRGGTAISYLIQNFNLINWINLIDIRKFPLKVDKQSTKLNLMSKIK